MASYSSVVASMKNEKAEGSEGRPGVLKSFARGLMQSPGSVEGLADFMRGRPNQPGIVDPRISRSQESMQIGAKLSGIAPPTTYGERVAERMGISAPLAIAGAPGAGAAAGLKGVGFDVIADVVGNMFGQGAEDVGFGPTGQMIAALPAALIAPNTAAGAAGAVARKGSRAFQSSLERTAKRTAAEAGEGLADVDRAALRAYAKKYGIEQKYVLEAASEWQRRFPRDPTGGTKGRDDVVAALEETNRLFPDPNLRPTTAQSIGDLGGENVAAMERSLAQNDLDFSASIAGRKKAVIEDLEKQFENMLPNGSYSRAQEASEAAWDRAKQAEREAWANVPLREIPNSLTARLKSVAASLKTKGAGRQYVPDEVGVIEDYGVSVSATELQALRSELMDTARAAKRFGASDDVRRKAMRVAPLLREVNRMIDEFPEEGGQLYKAARDLTRQNAEMFPPDSVAVSGLSQITDANKFVRGLRSSKDPVGEMSRARRIVEQEPGGSEGLERALIDELFDQELGNATPRSVLTKIRRHRGMYEAGLGKEKLAEVEDMAKKISIASRGIAGTAAATRATASGLQPFALMFSAAEAITSPTAAASKGLGAVLGSIARNTRTSIERNGIARELLLDTDMAIKLSKMPAPEAVPAWIKNWDKIVARSRARQKLNAKSVNQPFPGNMGGVR